MSAHEATHHDDHADHGHDAEHHTSADYAALKTEKVGLFAKMWRQTKRIAMGILFFDEVIDSWLKKLQMKIRADLAKQFPHATGRNVTNSHHPIAANDHHEAGHHEAGHGHDDHHAKAA